MSGLLLRLAYRLLLVYWYFARPHTLGVRVICVQDGQVLLVYHSYQDAWFFPGGGVRKSETSEQAARREAREEAGAELGELRLFGVYDNFQEYKNDRIIVFTAQVSQQQDTHDAEISAVRFFDLSNLPAQISPGCQRRLEELRHGQAPAFGLW